MTNRLTLPPDTNQVRGLAQYALDFLAGKFAEPSDAAYERVELFHLDSIACGVSALAYGTNAPNLLRREALEYRVAIDPTNDGRGATLFGSRIAVAPEKAVVANSSAVREWDSNGTNFGYDPERGHTAGEFGHNDFYPVVVAAAQIAGADGRQTLKAMLLLDEIRGRLAEVFSLKTYKIDHVVHGAIASAIVYGAMLGAKIDQLESAVGLVVAHYIPFRAIRHGKQLSDSKGASAAISSEVAVLSARRAMRGFVGPADIFRNAEAIFCLFDKPAAKGCSPFELSVGTSGDEFSILGMHFKLGLYEHQSAGAIQGLIDLLTKNPELLADERAIRGLRITIYQPAFDIIGDPAKRDPQTRQSADHSMVYIIATLLRKALEQRAAGWTELMLSPDDYDDAALQHPLTRRLMQRIDFRHGGPEYDARYPDGIPTSVDIEHDTLGTLSSGLVMYPEGHARNTSGRLGALLAHKFELLARPAVDDVPGLRRRFTDFRNKSPEEIRTLYDFKIHGVE
ncbi:MAG: MmgE/PrpD family protein [Planctomycetes bacterium]|nr:MmgE/PrpD family protein [Planctomycetota bacterium]